MNPVDMLKFNALSLQMRQMVDLLQSIDADALKRCIAVREGVEDGFDRSKVPAGALRAGAALTGTLKLALFFREEILKIQVSEADVQESIRVGEEAIARARAHGIAIIVPNSERDEVAEFLEGKDGR